MAGPERVKLYLLAANTGLRASELASLTWQLFVLDGPAPTVVVLAAFSKRRRDDTLPMRNTLAEQFKQWQAERNESSESNSKSLIGAGEGQNQTACEQNSGNVKPLQMAELGTKKEPMSLTDTGSKRSGPGWIRTSVGLRQRVYSPFPKNNKHSNSKDLQQDESGAYKPAYKQNPKTGGNEPVELPSDLAEIVAVWPDLPEHIKQTIKTIIETTTNNR